MKGLLDSLDKELISEEFLKLPLIKQETMATMRRSIWFHIDCLTELAEGA